MPKRETIHRTKIQRSYRTIVVVFFIVAILLVTSIAYFSFSKTTISVVAKPDPYSTTITFSIVQKTEPESLSDQTVLAGVVLETTQEVQKEFQAQTQKDTVPAKATGSVVIYNKQSKAQPLVAGTRLLSPENILFRTDTRVDVPANGQVEVTVTADQPGKTGELGATHFTLPALWPGQQDKVYAENAEPMTGGTRNTTVATREEIAKAKRETFDECYAKALDVMDTELKKRNADYTIRASKKEVISELSSVEPETATTTYTITTKIHVIGVSYDEQNANAQALKQSQNKVSSNATFILSTDTPYRSEVDQYDMTNQSANLRVTVSGSTIVNLSHDMFDRKKLMNMDREEVERYFAQYPEIESVEVHFSPFWLFRTPSLADHIDVKLQ